MNKRIRSTHVAAGIPGLLLAVCILCLLSCNSSIHEIYDNLMMVYSVTDSNRVINDPGSILVEAIEIDSERNKTEK